MLTGAQGAAAMLAEIAETDPDAAEFAAREAADLPEADRAWEWIWDAWWRLHKGDRPHVTVGAAGPLGGAIIQSRPMPLPWSILRLWGDRHGYGDEEFELFDACAMAMDEVYLEWWAEQNKVSS